MNNLYSASLLMLLLIAIFTGYNMVGGEISSNPNLDDQSLRIINNTNDNIGQFSREDFEKTEPNISSNTTFDDVDAFERSFLEEQSEAESTRSIYTNIKNIPELFFSSLGLPDEVIKPFVWILYTVISLIILVIGYRLLFGGGKITKR